MSTGPSDRPHRGRPDAQGRRRGAFAALGHRNFRLFWFGGVISSTGRFFQAVAIPAIIWGLTHSAAGGGG
ncbi:MAG: hypothetical protein ACE5GB_10370 [Acidimicrobiales bacterium]